jgi:hypothetical protein
MIEISAYMSFCCVSNSLNRQVNNTFRVKRANVGFCHPV